MKNDEAQVSAQLVADCTGGQIEGDPDYVITGVKSFEMAGPNDLAFIQSPNQLAGLGTVRAGIIILPPNLILEIHDGCKIRHDNPMLAMALATKKYFQQGRSCSAVSPQALIGQGVTLGRDVGIGPGAVVADGVHIGARSEIHPGATLGSGITIGQDCVIHAGVHIREGSHIGNRVILHSGAIIGADGFGYVENRLRLNDHAHSDEETYHHKIPQIGEVVIEDDVEIGANTTIDRATLSETRIGRGTKIDNQVQIGHNVRIGKHCILCGQVGISGSVHIGDYVVMGGQAACKDHVTIGDGAKIFAKTGVWKDVPKGANIAGVPAIDANKARSAYYLIERLPQIWRQMRDQSKRITRIEAKSSD